MSYHPGYRIEAKGVTGTVTATEREQSRIDTDDGDQVGVANRKIEPR